MARRRAKRSLNNDRKLRKDVVSYRCSNGHSWQSVHGWLDEESNARFNCEACGSKTTVIEATVTELFVGTCATCGSDWHVPLENPADQAIPCCGEVIDYQQRMCNYYVHRCTNDDCGTEWTDATVDKVYTQRCRKCFNAGVILGRRRMNAGDYKRRNQPVAVGNVGGHEPDLCDMCQKLTIDTGVSSCSRLKEVWTRKQAQIAQNGGIPVERVIFTK